MQPITPDARRLVERARLGFVATVSPDGTPNVSPKGTVVALDGGRLAFADIRSPDTVRNIASDPRVEVCVVDPVLRRGYTFAGEAESLPAGPELDAAVAMYRAAGVRSRIRGVVVVRVERAEEVASPLYDLGATEGEVRSRWAAHYSGA